MNSGKGLVQDSGEPPCCVVFDSGLFSFLSLSTRSCTFQTFFFSGAGNDPEVAQGRFFGCPRRHSRVPAEVEDVFALA